MNIYNIFVIISVVLINLFHSTDNRVLAPLLDAPEYDTTYSICYIPVPPFVPLTIDPSPLVLAPPFDPDIAPTPPHTFAGATSAGYGTNSSSADWEANFVMVAFIALLVQVRTLCFPNHNLPLTYCTRFIRKLSTDSSRTPVSQPLISGHDALSLIVPIGNGSSDEASIGAQDSLQIAFVTLPTSHTSPSPPSPSWSDTHGK